jgi:hypothetical protein
MFSDKGPSTAAPKINWAKSIIQTTVIQRNLKKPHFVKVDIINEVIITPATEGNMR